MKAKSIIIFVFLVALLCVGFATPALAQPTFTHSHYISNAGNSSMYNLGYNESNTMGEIILDFGCSSEYSSTYGTIDFSNTFDSMTTITSAVQQYIAGYNANTGHNQYISLAVGTNTSIPGSSYYLSTQTAEYNHGNAFRAMIGGIAPSGYVVAVDGANDAEIGFNTGPMTQSWVQGYASNNVNHHLMYDYGDDAGGTNPGTNQWTAYLVWYVEYGQPYDFSIPENYYDVDGEDDWQPLSLWAYNNEGAQIQYSGVMSENGNGGVNGLLSDSLSYTRLLYWLQQNTHTYQSALGYGTDI